MLVESTRMPPAERCNCRSPANPGRNPARRRRRRAGAGLAGCRRETARQAAADSRRTPRRCCRAPEGSAWPETSARAVARGTASFFAQRCDRRRPNGPCRGIEFLAEAVRQEIAGYQHEGRLRQCLRHLLQGRAEQHPIGVPPVSAEAAVTGAIEHCAPLFRLGGGQSVDQPRISHRVEMQIGHYEDLSGNGLRRAAGWLFAVPHRSRARAPSTPYRRPLNSRTKRVRADPRRKRHPSGRAA